MPPATMGNGAPSDIPPGDLPSILIGLVAACPHDPAGPADCPLAGKRQLGITSCAHWLAGISEREMRMIHLYHESCSARKRGESSSAGLGPQ